MSAQKDFIPSPEGEQQFELTDDFELLDMMLSDSKSQSILYRPGPYWADKAKNAAKEIKRCGLGSFRGEADLIGLSYTDNLHMDVRNTYNHGFLRRLARWLTITSPLRKIYDDQVNWTRSYAHTNILYAQEILNMRERTKELLKKYTIPYSLLGGCLRRAEIDGQVYSTHYLDTLEQHDNIASRINFHDAHSIFEIGGGFGTNVHLLIENYKNIRKILYLDIPPNLYVGTQYLKAFYGNAVFDYRSLKPLNSITFSTDDRLEIFCITPWQIEKCGSPVDIFMNSHSFVEMPKNIVKNYADKFSGLPKHTDTAIALATYENFDLRTTFHPGELPKNFPNREFDHFEEKRLIDSSIKNLYFVSAGKFSFQQRNGE